mmetsp:Transcript_17385/g.32997  ORF Transcript_17385/g.32997 Transcript_17385/m.32997 type:complete len:180 (-) Transcript_17385:687-1226(-)
MSTGDVKDSIFNPIVRRELEKERFEMTSKKYLDKHHVLKYLQDAIGLMIENKVERPLHFLADYFASIERGTNVLYRNFRYVNATPRNRKSFILQFGTVYKHIQPTEELSIDSFHHLLSLLCRDFPYSLVRNASRITMGQWGTVYIKNHGLSSIEVILLQTHTQSHLCAYCWRACTHRCI